MLGVPDAYYGETIKAVIVLRPGAALTAEEITVHCRAHLASYKRPRYVQFVSAAEIPRSTTGKILRHDLAARGASGRGADRVSLGDRGHVSDF